LSSNNFSGFLLEAGGHEYIREAVNFIEDAINNRITTAYSECTFESIFGFVNYSDYEQIRTEVCKLIEAGAIVVIGPPRREFGQFIEPICRELGLPFIKYHWDPIMDSSADETSSGSSTINLFPTSQFSMLLDKLLSHWKWDYFTFVYTDKDAKQTFRRFCWVKRNKVIIDMSPNNTLRFLDAALKLGMISIHNWFVVTSLDNLDDHLEQYVHNTMRLSLISIWKGYIDPLIDSNNKIKEMYYRWRQSLRQQRITPFRDFAYVFDAMITSCHLPPSQSKTRSCEAAPSPYNVIEPVRGLTGLLSFNANGERQENELQIWELGMDGTALNARVLRVSTIAERPYVMEKILPSGKVTYEGFCVDLLDRLASSLHISYEISIVKDSKYGEPVSANASEWDGMIGEILRGEADMAVGPITVTARRLEVVDFTDPFLQLGISMLMRQPMWYLVCILLRAGSGYNCQSAAARFLSAIWWMFTLVLFAQYTANFAAVLTVDRKNMPFNSFEELGNQSDYKFGAILGGSTMQFFKYSRIETFRRLWESMQNQTPTAFVEKNEDGVRRALQEKYVFLMESATLDYQVTQNCNLTRVGNVVLGSNGYSIAVPKGSKWREKLTRQILDLNEKGIIMMLKETWWKKRQQECETEPVEDRRALGVDHVKGLFVLLALGLGISLIISLSETFIYVFVMKAIPVKCACTIYLTLMHTV
ncbi:Ligand-gated ion channel, partial [Ancylostoma caninum]